ncbi:GntR family transcriptional regulator [Amorphus orientalis]|uniref:DNA-binding GntR family transcriptional regulator n=1 Tax=Amorphus orientalis TaxID=649198 RepID=A0AAE3VKK4_9HYPH|nr:GntR family transcriptional regulator [Amorphus orientalis]MDQ0313849.1 DNA-binding GntR family transcriptional regulator [Amorphus orientalis]
MTSRDRAAHKMAPRQTSLRQQVRDTIRRKIQHGEIGPDTRLVDLEIASRMGVSRMPVREALLELVSEGYLAGTTRGFVLPKLSMQDVADIFEIRKLLEPTAAANAARHLSDRAEADLVTAYERARRAHRDQDADEMGLANMQYRQIWLEAEPNWRLAATISRFADQVQTVRLATLKSPATRDVVMSGLDRMTAAFRHRDADAVEAAVRIFIEDAEAHFFATQKAAGDRPDAGRRRSSV